MRRKKERSKQGQTNKAKQHSTPKAVTFVSLLSSVVCYNYTNNHMQQHVFSRFSTLFLIYMYVSIVLSMFKTKFRWAVVNCTDISMFVKPIMLAPRIRMWGLKKLKKTTVTRQNKHH